MKHMCDYTINNSKDLSHLQTLVDNINRDIQREKQEYGQGTTHDCNN